MRMPKNIKHPKNKHLGVTRVIDPRQRAMLASKWTKYAKQKKLDDEVQEFVAMSGHRLSYRSVRKPRLFKI